MRGATPHACPYCRCAWDRGGRDFVVDERAPGYALVLAVDRIILGEQRERYRRTVAAHRPTEGGADVDLP